LIFVPTRRAARSLRESFAEALGGAALLPRIVALGDTGEDELDPLNVDFTSPPPIAPLRRRFLLARLVERWNRAARGTPLSIVQAVAHASELGRFLDEALTQRVDLANLKTLAPEDFAAHWQEVLAFLDIVAVQWPSLLAAEGASEAAACRDASLRGLAATL